MPRALAVISSHGLGAADGLIKNADLAAGRTALSQQRSAWLEGGALLVGLILVAMGESAGLGEGLLYGAEAVVADRGGMWAGKRITQQGPGHFQMPELIDASVTPLPMGGGRYQPPDRRYLPPNPMGGTSFSAIYPAQRERAGLLG